MPDWSSSSSRRQSPEASSRNDRSKSRYSKRSPEKRCESPDRRSFERLELKADLKDMVSERLKSRKRQEDRRSRSIEKSYERYRDQSFDNRESTIKGSLATHM